MNREARILGQLVVDVWIGVAEGTKQKGLDPRDAGTEVRVSVKNLEGVSRLVGVAEIPQTMGSDLQGGVIEVRLLAIANHLIQDKEYGLHLVDFTCVLKAEDPQGILRRYTATVVSNDTCAGFLIRQSSGDIYKVEGYSWFPGE